MDTGFRALFISLCIHAIIASIWSLLPSNKIAQSIKPVEIVVLATPNKLPKNESKLVREALVPDKLKVQESNDPLKFWSKDRVRVKEQTRAAEIGKTQNAFNNQNSQRSNPIDQALRDGLKNPNEVAINHQQNTARSRSTIGESLPEDVKIGSFTSLNTDRYLFYSFYSRVEEKIRDNWEDSVINALRRTPKEKLEANFKYKWITSLEALVYPDGRLLKILLLKPSGLPALDEAAIQSFIRADYFPNPPREMVQDDGLIHLNYSFTVHADPNSLAGY